MDDQQKQIEEDKKQLIKLLKNSKSIVTFEENAYEISPLRYDERKFFITTNNGHLTIHFDKIVDEIYNAGYRNCKDKAVLSKEEIEIQQEIYLNGIKYWQDMANKARKQAVKEFAEMVKNDIKIYLTEDLDFLMKWYEFKLFMDERAKAFGVEL